MAYGKIKADTLVYDNSGSDVEVTLSSLGNKAPLASPTFTGTVTIPTPAANDNTTKAASTAYVQTELGDYLTTALGAPKASPALTGTATAVNLTLSGDLTVNGTTTTINSTTLAVDDKNIELGTVDTPSDTTADGGGITLKGATDKTFNWVDATDAWTSSEHIVTASGKNILIGTTTEGHVDADNLTVSGSGNTGITIRSTDSNETNIFFSDGLSGSDEYKGIFRYHHPTNSFVFKTDATDALTIDSSQNATFNGTVSDSKGNVRKIPLNNQTSAYVPVTADSGKVIHISTGGVTINTGVMLVGDVITIINNSGSDQTITQGSGFTMYNSGDGSTGNRTLGTRGMATLWYGAQDWGYISGAGLS